MPISDVTFVPDFDEVRVASAPGKVSGVKPHAGPTVQLRKLGRDRAPNSRLSALALLAGANHSGERVTSLRYLAEPPDPARHPICPRTRLTLRPAALIRPGRDTLDEVVAGLR